MKNPDYTITIAFSNVSTALSVIDFLTDNDGNVAPTASVTVANAPAFDPQIGVDLDSTGAPWLAEVHSSTKTKDANGVWAGRRGKSKEARAAAEAAAKAQLAGTPAAVIPSNATPAGGWMPPAGPGPLTVPAPVMAMPAPVMAMPAPVMAMPAPVAAPVSYEMLVEKYGQLAATNRIDGAGYAALCNEIGVTDPAQLATNETLRAALYARFVQLGA